MKAATKAAPQSRHRRRTAAAQRSPQGIPLKATPPQQRRKDDACHAGRAPRPNTPTAANTSSHPRIDHKHCRCEMLLAREGDTPKDCRTAAKRVASLRPVTFAVMVKVHDGLVLATDSATTVQLPNALPQVYNNADKIFNLHRELPVAAMTWGLGHVGSASISTVAKDLRRRLMGQDKDFEGWKLDVGNYAIRNVADRVSEIFHGRLKAESQPFPAGCLGMLVAGYSANAAQSEAWSLLLDGQADDPPAPVEVANHDAAGWLAWAVTRAVHRLFMGYDQELLNALTQALPAQHHGTVANVLQAQALQPVFPQMPFPDAIDLARFLVQVKEGFAHFLLGPAIVGGPIEVAGVNRHEGFKWINRKHYYSLELALLFARTQPRGCSMIENMAARSQVSGERPRQAPEPEATQVAGQLYSMRDPERRAVPSPDKPPAAGNRENR